MSVNGIPEEFIRMIEGYNAPELSGLPGALLTEPDVSVRVNRLKGAAAAARFDRVPWCAEGYYLPARIPFAFDAAWHQGLYYVQDASSMFVSHVVRTLCADGVARRVLDACAAPGGKTTAAISALPEGSVVVANEFVAQRCTVLRENLAKWGYPYVSVTQGSTERFRRDAPGVFDIVLADVPCSGEGMMRKDAEAVEQWSRGLVEQCAARQREIVDNLWPAIAPGGYLIYSTCTFNRTENEEMLDYIVDNYGASSVDIPVDSDWSIAPGVDTPHRCYRFIPGRVRGEGLFMAVLRKPADEACVRSCARKKKAAKSGGASRASADRVCGQVAEWLTLPARFSVEDDAVVARFETETAAGLPEEMRPRLVVGRLKGRDIVPAHELSMSTALAEGVFARCDVDYATAVEYLRSQAVVLPGDAPRGPVLLTHGGVPLGFVKNLGNRANNLYPKSWRIVSEPSVPAFEVVTVKPRFGE